MDLREYKAIKDIVEKHRPNQYINNFERYEIENMLDAILEDIVEKLGE